MRSISVLALACGAGAFAPQQTLRTSTALAVHRPRVPVPNTSCFKLQTGRRAATRMLRYGRRTAPKYTRHTTALNAASVGT